MSQPWQQGSAARQPQYDETPNPFTPVNYGARLKQPPKRAAQQPSAQAYQPGQMYGYQPPVYSPPPAPAPNMEQPAYMNPQPAQTPQLTPGAPYGQNAYQNGPMPYPQAFGQPQMMQQPVYQQPVYEQPVCQQQPPAGDQPVYEPVSEKEPFVDPFTPAQEPKDLKKIRPEDQPAQRAPVRVGRVIALAAAVIMLVFCAAAIVSIALKVDRDSRSFESAESSFLRENGIELQHAAARVELLPKGQTYEPTAEPAQTPYRAQALLPVVTAAVEAEAAETRSKLTSYPKNPMCNVHDSLKPLIAENPDVMGRLVIPGLLDEVIVQRNNTYYLTHDAYGNGSDAGAVFIDESCALRMPPENLLLRGQSAVGGKVFSKLWQYVNGGTAFAAQMATATLTTLYEEEPYVLFSVILSDSDPRSDGYFDYAGHPTFASDESMLAFVQNARARSLYPFGVDVNASDRLLTLATLGSGDQSVVLMYRMAREGENY